MRLSPPPSEKDYCFNLDDSEGVCDLFDVLWWRHTIDVTHIRRFKLSCDVTHSTLQTFGVSSFHLMSHIRFFQAFLWRHTFDVTHIRRSKLSCDVTHSTFQTFNCLTLLPLSLLSENTCKLRKEQPPYSSLGRNCLNTNLNTFSKLLSWLF